MVKYTSEIILLPYWRFEFYQIGISVEIYGSGKFTSEYPE